MEQSPSWEANSSSASQEIPCILWNQRFIIPFTTAHPLSLSWVTAVQSLSPLPTPWRSIFNICHPSAPRSSKWLLSLRTSQQNPIWTSPVPHMCLMSCPSHSPWFDYPQPMFLPQCERPSFTPIKNNRQNCSSVYVYIYIYYSYNCDCGSRQKQH